MAYRIWRSPAFLADIEAFGRYCASYTIPFAEDQFSRLNFIIENLIAETPLTWAYFIHTGEPYRAYLFRVGERTQFWIIYSVNPVSASVNLLRLWGVTQDPERLEV